MKIEDLGLQELTPQRYNLYPTGDESPPRKKYKLYKYRTGLFHLAKFFGLSIEALDIDKHIWLTPSTLETFLIFTAFNFDGFPLVIRTENEAVTTLYGVLDLTDEIEQFVENSNATLYINPAVQP